MSATRPDQRVLQVLALDLMRTLEGFLVLLRVSVRTAKYSLMAYLSTGKEAYRNCKQKRGSGRHVRDLLLDLLAAGSCLHTYNKCKDTFGPYGCEVVTLDMVLC